jgi:hypothetical protein
MYFTQGINFSGTISVLDRHRFNADPTFHLDAGSGSYPKFFKKIENLDFSKLLLTVTAVPVAVTVNIFCSFLAES